MEKNINQNSANNYEAILKQAASSGKVNRLSKTYPAFIVLILFVAISFLVRDSFQEKVNSDTQAAFDKAVNSVMMRVDNKYRSNLQVLTSIQGLYDAYVDVVRDYFKLYSSVPTTTNQSIKSLMFVPKIKNSELSDHIFNMQRQGLWDYKLHPQSEKEFYYPIEFIEPLERNEANAGFDFNSIAGVNSAIEKARDNNIITATNVAQTISNKDGEGFYLIAPIYLQNSARETLAQKIENFRGVVIQEIDADRFFKDALGGNFPSDTSIIFELVEIDGAKESLIFTSKNINQLDKKSFDGLITKQVINIADKKIEARFYTIPNFRDWFTANLHHISFGVSLLLSFVFFGFVYSVTTSRARALDLAERMTRSQRRIVESSKDIISVLDMSGNWKSLNPAADAIFGITSANLIGKNITELFVTAADNANFTKMINGVQGEQTIRADFEMKSAEGDNRWISWSFTVATQDALIYAVGRDVTLEKLAEQQAMLRSKQMKLAEQFTREASEFKSYFMTKLSHQMRNSLTGIIGYLQLLSMKIYESEEEQDSYIALAEESSEELFAFVSDMVDVAIGSKENSSSIATFKIDKVLKSAVSDFVELTHHEKQIHVALMDEYSVPPNVVADEQLLNKAMVQIFKAVSQGINDIDIQIAATENSYEGATEIQMLTNSNPLVAEMIDVYKANSQSIIETLDKDREDVLLDLAIASSIIRMMNGTMTVETFGAEDGNVVQITLPLNKKQN